jgi:hypothetical protein
MAALDSITTSSGDVKTPLSPVLPAVRKRKRRVIVAAAATVALGTAVAVFASQRDEPRAIANAHADTAVQPASRETTKAAAPPPAAPVPAPVPVVLTRADSIAIADAVRDRLAEEQASKGSRQVVMLTDSIIAEVRKLTIDSIVRATIPRGVPIPVWSETPPRPAAAARAGAAVSVAVGDAAIKRVVVIEPRPSRTESLNSFAAALTDSIRRSLSRRRGYHVVAEDSVKRVLETTRARSAVERMTNADIMITPSFVGIGDTVTVLVTLRDVRNSAVGSRVASGKIQVSDPAPAIPALVKLVDAQLQSMHVMRSFRFSAPPATVRGNNER